MSYLQLLTNIKYAVIPETSTETQISIPAKTRDFVPEEDTEENMFI